MIEDIRLDECETLDDEALDRDDGRAVFTGVMTAVCA